MIIEDLGKKAEAVAGTVVVFIEHDMASYIALNEVTDYSQETYDLAYYQQMLSIFNKIKEASNSSYVYTVKKVSDQEFMYILDGEEQSSEFFSPIGTVEVMYPELQTVFETNQKSYTKELPDEIWGGSFVTGYSPINDLDSGEVIGVVAVDFSTTLAEPIVTQSLNNIIIFSVAIILGLTFVIYYLLQSKIAAVDTDYLTDLFSKRHFDRHLQINIVDATVRKQPLSLMMIDLDNFKQINDEYGHLTGDKILRSVADVIKGSIRNHDICSRYGGDEFCIILPDTDGSKALLVAERIQENMEKMGVDEDGKRISKIVLSIGIAEWNKDLGSDELINRADIAMYKTKKSATKKVAIYSEDLIIEKG